MANVFGKIRKRLRRRRAARRPEARVEARPEARPEARLREILDNRIATYERVMRDINSLLRTNNSSINTNEAAALYSFCWNNINALEDTRRWNPIDFVNSFPTEDGRDIKENYKKFLSRNGIDPASRDIFNENREEEPVRAQYHRNHIIAPRQDMRVQREAVQPNGGIAENNRPVNQVQAEAAGRQQRREQGEIAQPDAGRARNSQRRLNERPEERLEERSERGATGISSNNQEAIVNDILSAYGAGQNESIRQDFLPRGDSLNNNGVESGRPEQRISTVEPNVMDNNANTDIYDSAQNYYRSGVINRFENAELPPTPNASESNSTGSEDPPRVDSLNYNGGESGSSIQEEANVNELVSSYEDREEADVNESVSSYEDREEADVNELVSSYEDREEADVNELVSSYENREEADVNELVSSYENREEADVNELVSLYENREEADVNELVSLYQEQENVRDVTSENYSDRRVSSSFDSSIGSYDASNSLDTSTTSYDTRSSLGTSTTSYDTRSSLGTSTTSYDTRSSLGTSTTSYDTSSSLDSSYFSSDISHNRGTYNRKSSDSNYSNQLVKNDSDPKINNQRRNSQSF